MNGTRGKARVFKTRWFSRAARKVSISDHNLCSAIGQLMLGQADDLGGGVFKKRIGNNQYRSIILAKGGRNWFFAYLFAKQDRANIKVDELESFRHLAKVYARKTDADIESELRLNELVEICNGG
jgi:hypothetical protein